MCGVVAYRITFGIKNTMACCVMLFHAVMLECSPCPLNLAMKMKTNVHAIHMKPLCGDLLQQVKMHLSQGPTYQIGFSIWDFWWPNSTIHSYASYLNDFKENGILSSKLQYPLFVKTLENMEVEEILGAIGIESTIAFRVMLFNAGMLGCSPCSLDPVKDVLEMEPGPKLKLKTSMLNSFTTESHQNRTNEHGMQMKPFCCDSFQQVKMHLSQTRLYGNLKSGQGPTDRTGFSIWDILWPNSTIHSRHHYTSYLHDFKENGILSSKLKYLRIKYPLFVKTLENMEAEENMGGIGIESTMELCVILLHAGMLGCSPCPFDLVKDVLEMEPGPNVKYKTGILNSFTTASHQDQTKDHVMQMKPLWCDSFQQVKMHSSQARLYGKKKSRQVTTNQTEFSIWDICWPNSTLRNSRHHCTVILSSLFVKTLEDMETKENIGAAIAVWVFYYCVFSERSKKKIHDGEGNSIPSAQMSNNKDDGATALGQMLNKENEHRTPNVQKSYQADDKMSRIVQTLNHKRCRTKRNSIKYKQINSNRQFRESFYRFYVKWTKAFDLEKTYIRSSNVAQVRYSKPTRKNTWRMGGKKRRYVKSKYGASIMEMRTLTFSNKTKRLTRRVCPLRTVFEMYLKIITNMNPSTESVIATEVENKRKWPTDVLKRIRDAVFGSWRVPVASYIISPVQTRLDSYFCHSSLSSSDEHFAASNGSMEVELLRLETFKTFPRSSPVSTLYLAKSGFFYTGKSDIVECFHCHVQHGEWRKGNNPLEVHKRISPNCRFLTGHDTGNHPVELPHSRSTHYTSTSNDSSLFQSENDSLGPQTSDTSQEFPTRSTDSSTTEYATSLPTDSLPYSRLCTEEHHSTSDSDDTINSEHFNASSESLSMTTAADKSGYLNGCSALETSSLNVASKQRSPGKFPDNYTSNNTSTKQPPVPLLRLEPLGLYSDRPKHPEYAVLTVRMSSYKGWSSYTGQTPKDLAEAGFIYGGSADLVRCYFCSIGLRNWEPDDDPWIEHAKWSPKCVYLRQTKGDAFILLVHDGNDQIPRYPANNTNASHMLGRQETTAMPQTLVPIVDHSLAVKIVREMGYPLEVIQNAIDKLTKANGRIDADAIVNELLTDDNISSSGTDWYAHNGDRLPNGSDYSPHTRSASNGIVSGMEDMELQDHMASLMAENRRMKENLACKICLDSDAVITFIPCGHLVCCNECGSALRKCPMCRKVIQARVKTWMA